MGKIYADVFFFVYRVWRKPLRTSKTPFGFLQIILPSAYALSIYLSPAVDGAKRRTKQCCYTRVLVFSELATRPDGCLEEIVISVLIIGCSISITVLKCFETAMSAGL